MNNNTSGIIILLCHGFIVLTGDDLSTPPKRNQTLKKDTRCEWVLLGEKKARAGTATFAGQSHGGAIGIVISAAGLSTQPYNPSIS
ncbi:TPA: hypothetical protein ACWV6C_000002 [Salmonella enterica subsp. enterica serovar Muenchen]|uniref:Uncharacterized protein n=1 Tax=Salmonella enterica TaxID=28901 RepID=A0A749KXZ0_SALER|nr:hypothetical protein [Salmonella enterica]HBM0000425.1 hypothetical protein [Salmonella enterica subsp. enterica serovar Kodjovi]EEI4534974.1 hypothetical protein [Salmonella enterica]EIX3164355.1 hypothetical protein [Salmonella enterica]EJI6537286.1 hypothetical protein [Salmonella enterica]